MSLPNIIRQFQNQERDGSFFLLFAHWRFRVCRKNATQSGWPQHPHIGGCAILPGTKRVSNHVLVLNPFLQRLNVYAAKVWDGMRLYGLQALVFQKHATGLSYDPAVGSTNADRILFLAFGFVINTSKVHLVMGFHFQCGVG